MVRINARTSLGTPGRPGLPFRTFQAQNRRKRLRCQPMTVEALTMKTLDCQSFQTALSQAHSNRSAGVGFGRLTERCRTPSGDNLQFIKLIGVYERDSRAPVLKKSRWLLLKRSENLGDEQHFRLRDLLRYNLKTVRAYLLKEAFQQLW